LPPNSSSNRLNFAKNAFQATPGDAIRDSPVEKGIKSSLDFLNGLLRQRLYIKGVTIPSFLAYVSFPYFFLAKETYPAKGLIPMKLHHRYQVNTRRHHHARTKKYGIAVQTGKAWI
jgi:hypothetical protein